VPPDFSWAFHAHVRVTGERVTISGRALLDAFEEHKPRLFFNVVAIDGVDVVE
jgi:hypothetical protein